MTIKIVDNKPSLEELTHFGVKGMHWGQRNAARAAIPRQSGYSDGAHEADKKKFGTRGVNRINERMSKGMGYSDARKAEQKRRRNRNLMVAGTYVAVRMLQVYGPIAAQIGAQHYVGSKNEKAGQKASADLFSDRNGIGNHKIVDLGYDSSTGKWS